MFRILGKTALATALVFTLTGVVYAKGGSSSGGFSGGSKSSPSSSSGSRAPSFTAPSAPRPSAPSISAPRPSTSGGFSAGSREPSSGHVVNPAEPTPAHPIANPPISSYDRSVNRRESAKAFESRKSEVAKTRQDPAFQAATGGRTYQPAQISSARSRYVEVHHYNYVPTYTYGYHPWGFSDFMLNMMVYDALFGYHHRDDADYRAWRREAEERATTDAQLREQLAQLDRDVKALEAKGPVRDPHYMPKDTPPEVMYSEEALTGKVAEAKDAEEDDTDKPSSGFPWFWIVMIGVVVIVGGFGTAYVLSNRETRNPGF